MATTNSTPLTRSKQLQNPLLQSVLLIIAAILLWWFVITPKYADVMSKRDDLAKINGQKAVFEKEQIDLNKLVAKLESSDAEIKLADEALPLSTRPTQIAMLMESYARSSSLEISQINIQDLDKTIIAGNKDLLDQPYKAKRDLLKVKVSIGVSGTIDQFKNFLELLENSGRIVDVNSFDVSTSQGTTKFSLDLTTYAYEPLQ